MVSPGNVIYFKRARHGTKRSHQEFQFKGFGFGVFLGHVPPFGPEPTAAVVRPLMSAIGYFTFDDLGELMGDEVAAEFIRRFEVKYQGQVAPDQLAVPSSDGDPDEAPDPGEGPKPLEPTSRVLALPQKPGLVGPDGKPVGVS